MNNFRQFLERKYLEWQQQEGGRKTVFEFAEWLGFNQSTVSNWWNENRTPQGHNIRKLADKLGLEVYDVLGLERPDSDLYRITKHWDDLPPDLRRSLREQAESFLNNDTKRTPQKRRTRPAE